jgi:hypothetical protein
MFIAWYKLFAEGLIDNRTKKTKAVQADKTDSIVKEPLRKPSLEMTPTPPPIVALPPTPPPWKSWPKFCSHNPSLCELQISIKKFVSTRKRPDVKSIKGLNKSLIPIFVHGGVRSWYGEQHWFNSVALERCPINICRLVPTIQEAVVELCNLRCSNHDPNRAYAAVNLEAHSFDNPPHDFPNFFLLSYHQESDIVINNGFHITHKSGLCLGQRVPDQKCENMETRASPFYRSSNRDDLLCPTRIRGCNSEAVSLPMANACTV